MLERVLAERPGRRTAAVVVPRRGQESETGRSPSNSWRIPGVFGQLPRPPSIHAVRLLPTQHEKLHTTLSAPRAQWRFS